MVSQFRRDLLSGLCNYIHSELKDRGFHDIRIENIRDRRPSETLKGSLGIDVYDASSFSSHLCFIYRKSVQGSWRKGVVSLIRRELTIMDISKCRGPAEIIRANVNLLISTEPIPVVIKRFFNHAAGHPLLKYSTDGITNIGRLKNGVIWDWYPRAPMF